MTFSSSSTAVTDEQEHPSLKRSNGNRIKKLPPLLVNQLAAGEVVTRPASVVKELIENAIDADAKNIEIRITQGGMGIIEVCDDGCGIHPDDMIMAVTRFATSKIADIAHLQGIATLGFRGEALAATAAVSRLTLTSCSDDSGIGRELNVAGILDDTPQMMPVVHPQGTTVSVKDLYFNVPARRGNLKSISTEYAHIETVVKQLALVASDVSFKLWHNDKLRFNFDSIGAENNGGNSETLAGSESMQSVLTRLTALIPSGHDQAELFSDTNLQPVSIDLEALRSQHYQEQSDQQLLNISGFLIPSYRPLSSSSYKLIYINGRLVKDRRIAQSLRDSAANFADLDSLGYVLFFNLPKVWLNLNVHPSKQCIKIQNLANVMAHLEVGIRDALQLWQQRCGSEQFAMYSKHKKQKHNKAQALTTTEGLSVQQSVSSYKIDNNQPISTDSYHSKKENLAQSQGTTNDGFSSKTTPDLSLSNNNIVNAEFEAATQLQSLPTVTDQITCLGVITANEIPESLVSQLKIKAATKFSFEPYMVLLQFKQQFYLFTLAGLYQGLQDLGIPLSEPDLVGQSDKLEVQQKLNTELVKLNHCSQLEFDAIEWQNRVADYALAQLPLLELALILIKNSTIEKEL